MQEDPYKAPESDLSANQAALPKTLWWKVLFFIWVLLLVLLFAGIALTDEIPLGIMESIDLLISLVILFALFGLAFNKAIGKRVFWQYFFYVNFITTVIYSIVFPVFGIEIYGVVTEFNLEYLIGMVFAVLTVWASYVYGYRRGVLWGDGDFPR